MHQRAAPLRVAEQRVRPLALGQKILVGLVEDQRDAALAGELVERVNGFARIDRAGRIVGRDQHDGARLGADQPGGILGSRDCAGARAEIERHRLDALHA
jgi:hypothetical protein